MLNDAVITEAAELRRRLHALPEIAGAEDETADIIAGWLALRRPDRLLRSVGGTGVVAVFDGAAPGPTVVLRAELDGLPISELADHDHASRRPGRGHLCGHDGHMAMVASMAELMAKRRPQRGRLVLLFQAAEETGEGAAMVVADPVYRELAPDWVFALHNLPGLPLAQVAVREGCFACGSLGVAATLTGRSSHAAYPEQGLSPGSAMCRIIKRIKDLAVELTPSGRIALATVIHARLGDVAFGTSPGEATVMATLRADDEALLTDLERAMGELVADEAGADGLGHDLRPADRFPVTLNDRRAVAVVRAAAAHCGNDLGALTEPFLWSEDFGHYGGGARAALVGLGSGEEHEPLHSPYYDFPDALLEPGVRLWAAIVDELLGGAP